MQVGLLGKRAGKINISFFFLFIHLFNFAR